MPKENAEDQAGQELKQTVQEVTAASEELIEKAVAGLKIQDPGLAKVDGNESEEGAGTSQSRPPVSADASKCLKKGKKRLLKAPP